MAAPSSYSQLAIVTAFSRFKYGYKIPKYTSIDNATTVMEATIIVQRLEWALEKGLLPTICLRRKKCMPYAIIALKIPPTRMTMPHRVACSSP